MQFTIYHEIDRRLKDSTREEVIRNGWGTTTPGFATKESRKATKIQVFELTEAESAEWFAANQRMMQTLWTPWGKK